MRTTTISTMAPPTALTRRVAAAIRNHWHEGNLEAVAEAAIDAVCKHLARTSDESIDPRINDAVERFLSYEYHEADSCGKLECAAEEIPGQSVLNLDTGEVHQVDEEDMAVIPYREALAAGMVPAAPAGQLGGVRPAAPEFVDPDQLCSWNVRTGPDGKLEFVNLRPIHRLSLIPLLFLCASLLNGCAPSTASVRESRDGHQVEAPTSSTKATGTDTTASRPTMTVEGYSARPLTAAEAEKFPPPQPSQSNAETWAELGFFAVCAFGFCFVLWVLVGGR